MSRSSRLAAQLALSAALSLSLIACGSSSSPDDGGADHHDSGPLPPDPCTASGTCPKGVWINVTPKGVVDLDFGPGPVVVDPGRPMDLYMGGGGDGIWKSVDYGNTWTQINTEIGYIAMGLIIAVAPTQPQSTVWVAGHLVVHRSTNAGASFDELPLNIDEDLYSIQVDPYDSTHLISGLHEVDGIVESTDSGATWTYVGETGFPSGGVSWYPFFIDTGSAATTRETWIAIAQNGGSVVKTENAGGSWKIPTGINGLVHPHGNTQIHQQGASIFVTGNAGPGDGIYRSTDWGDSFTRVSEGGGGIVWGTQENVYAMWSWACSGCDLGARFSSAPVPGTTWTDHDVPDAVIIGANHIAVTSDGTHDIFVGTMWASGVWRYVEP